MSEEKKQSNMDKRITALNAELTDMALHAKRNSTEAVYLFLEKIVLPELRSIGLRLDRLQATVEELGGTVHDEKPEGGEQ